jgi:hypothetical protein
MLKSFKIFLNEGNEVKPTQKSSEIPKKLPPKQQPAKKPQPKPTETPKSGRNIQDKFEKSPDLGPKPYKKGG